MSELTNMIARGAWPAVAECWLAVEGVPGAGGPRLHVPNRQTSCLKRKEERASVQTEVFYTWREPKALEFQDVASCCPESRRDWVGTTLAIELGETPTGTRVHLVHSGYPAKNEV